MKHFWILKLDSSFSFVWYVIKKRTYKMLSKLKKLAIWIVYLIKNQIVERSFLASTFSKLSFTLFCSKVFIDVHFPLIL